LSTKILEFLNTGRIQSLQDGHSPPLPSDILAWIELPGLSERTVRLLYSRLGIRTLDDLEALAKSHFLRTLPGFGGSEPELLQAIALRRNMESDR
jgi:DNA polymerase (family 10)